MVVPEAAVPALFIVGNDHDSHLPSSTTPPPSMSLLTPSETHAFQSFLSSIDYTNTLHSAAAAPEWTMYSAGELDPSPEDAPELLPVISQPHGKEALTKATRDLMALDASAYSDHNSGSGFSLTEYANHQNQMENEHEHDLHRQEQQQSNDSQTRYTQGSLHPSQLFPFLKFRQNESPPDNRQHHRSTQRQTYPTTDSVPPLHIANLPSSASSTRTGSSTSRERTTPSPPVETLSHAAYSNIASSSTIHSSTPPSLSTFPLSQQSKRPITHEPARQLSNKRPKPSPTGSEVKSAHLDTKQSVRPPKLQTQAQQQPTVPAVKPSLLSPSQKKANHIQSEQKRRANIRRGYEALCEVVPALREAIRAEEGGRSSECAAESAGARGKRKRKSGREEREKADGRAGPRSENVVLQKTIDYITELTDEQAALLKRLHRARAALGNSAVSVPPVEGVPLWEREWTGGGGWNGQDEGDEEDEEDG